MITPLAKRFLTAAALLSSLAAAEPTQGLRNIKVGDQAPPFSLQTLDGATVSLSGYRGKTLLLLYVRAKQSRSLEALRVVQRVLNDNRGAGLAILAVSAKSPSPDYFKELAAEHGLSFPLAMDPQRKLYGGLGVLVTPVTLLIDETGVLRFELPHLPPNYETRLRLHADLLLGKIGREEHDVSLGRVRENKIERSTAADRRLNLAKALLEQGQARAAVPLLLKLRAESDSVPATVLLGTAYLELRRPDEAAKCLDPLVVLHPCPPELSVALGRLELGRGRVNLAEAYFLQALESAPGKGPILYQLGLLYESSGRLEEAVESYRRAYSEGCGLGP